MNVCQKQLPGYDVKAVSSWLSKGIFGHCTQRLPSRYLMNGARVDKLRAGETGKAHQTVRHCFCLLMVTLSGVPGSTLWERDGVLGQKQNADHTGACHFSWKTKGHLVYHVSIKVAFHLPEGDSVQYALPLKVFGGSVRLMRLCRGALRSHIGSGRRHRCRLGHGGHIAQ